MEREAAAAAGRQDAGAQGTGDVLQGGQGDGVQQQGEHQQQSDAELCGTLHVKVRLGLHARLYVRSHL